MNLCVHVPWSLEAHLACLHQGCRQLLGLREEPQDQPQEWIRGGLYWLQGQQVHLPVPM